MANVGADPVKFGAQNVSFGMLVAPNLAPWGPSSDAGGLGSTRKETLGVQAWTSIDLQRISGPPFRSFCQLWHNNCVFWQACLQVTFLNWGSRIKHLVWKILQKPGFHICRDYVDFGDIFTWFSMALGPILMTFGGLGACLKLHDFRWLSGGVPELRQHGHSRLFGTLPGPHCHPPNSFQQQFNMQNTS